MSEDKQTGPARLTNVGEMIKKFREGAGMTLQQLAQRAGVSEKELESIENDMISPALGVLTKICDGLGVSLGRFFQQGPRKFYSLVRASDEKAGTRFASKNGADHGYVYLSLGSEKRSRVMEPFLVTLTPPSDTSGLHRSIEEDFGTHSGEEFIYVLEGKVRVELEDQSWVLEPGDSIYYDATVPHRVLHHGSEPAKVLAVIHIPQRDS
ncbi:MAG: cupin domain-containing protein [Deltaproteobacteria bacterium]|nr:MAG: cupin domain-containing protein [Deltaproteobacteria bacterium]